MRNESVPELKKEGDWRHSAACLDHDAELFFPIGNKGLALLQIKQAKAVCNECPVIATCLEEAVKNGEDFGVWGGQSEDERRATKRQKWREQSRKVADRAISQAQEKS